MKSAKKDLTNRNQKLLKGNNIKVLYDDDANYSKQQFVVVYKHYDFLENLFVVRTYIQKRYKIDVETIELLLKLMGLKVFSRKDYSEIPKSFSWSRWNNMKESGYVNMIMDNDDVEKRLFTLSPMAKNIVTKFYKYLSGEEKIPEKSSYNPMNNFKEQVPFDRKKMELIKKINKLPIKSHNKNFFT